MPLWGKLAETWKHQKTLNQWMQSLQWGLNPLDQIQSKTMMLKEQCFQARKEASRLNTPAHEKHDGSSLAWCRSTGGSKGEGAIASSYQLPFINRMAMLGCRDYTSVRSLRISTVNPWFLRFYNSALKLYFRKGWQGSLSQGVYQIEQIFV